MWLSYTDSEEKMFHPICEEALITALANTAKGSDYRVLHHEYTGTLEMDFVIQNTATGKYLCVIEVKRTPSDVNSARYQYQAMTYAINNAPISEKPYYVLTNLEYFFTFRYDPTRPRVVQQMLKPGLRHIGNFADYDKQEDFMELLIEAFADMITCFLDDRYEYLATLDQFENHMRNIRYSSPMWKSSLVIMLYEYIRGAFLSIDRQPDLPYDVRKFRNNVEQICAEAARVNFKEIFTYSPNNHEKTMMVANDTLSNIFDFGRQSVSGDSIAELLHSIVSSNAEPHEGVVLTDLELARIVAILAKSISGEIETGKYICDPAAGSGNLLSAATEFYNIAPNQIKANDINVQLIELLSLRIGLNYAKVVNAENSAEITSVNIVDLPKGYFNDVSVIVMNPPFVAGVNCSARKQELFRKIREISGKDAKTRVGQMNLEGVFLETVCALCKPGTVISCVLPNTHLAARGREAIALRKFLLADFGLSAIFSYPDDGLFENVVKSTCVILGRVGTLSENVKIISSTAPVADIDLHTFENVISKDFIYDSFSNIAPGIDCITQTRESLTASLSDGWRLVCREFDEATSFVDTFFQSNDKLTLMRSISKRDLPRKRGPSADRGYADLIQLDMDSDLYHDYVVVRDIPVIPSIKSPKTFQQIIINYGDTVCFDAEELSDDDLSDIVDDYLSIPQKTGQQPKNKKDKQKITVTLKSDSRKLIPANSVLLPRLPRSIGKVFITTSDTIISTNLYTLNMATIEAAKLMASWCSTIFYQLICEINSKPQEGVRKMECRDFEATYIPVPEKLTKEQKICIIAETGDIEFLTLNNPKIRNIDRIWAEVLFAENASARLSEAKRLLEFLANMRNPQSLADK